MIDRNTAEQIVAQYTKHGWTLRRVLTSARAGGEAAGVLQWPDGVEVLDSELDALWFSRSSNPAVTTWELRHLSETPYALVTGIPADADPETAESILKETELQMLSSRGAAGRAASPPGAS